MKIAMETRAMPSDVEQKNALISEMENLIDNAKIEKRSLSNKELTRFNALKNEIAEIDLRMVSNDFSKFTTTKTATSDASSGKTPQQVKEERAFINFVQSGEIRDLSSTGSNVIVPKTISDQVISRVKELAPIFDLCTHYNVTGDLSIPTYDWTAHNTAFMTEFTPISASGGSFLTVDLKSFPFGTLAKIGRSLLNRSDIPTLDIIIEQMAMSIANFINAQLIQNTGLKFSGTLKSVTQTVTGETTLVYTVNDLVNLQMSVPSIFQQNAVWLLHPTTFGEIRKLKSTTGELLMVSDNQGLTGDIGYKLLGKPVLLDENVDLNGVGKRTIYYGDFSGMACNTNAPLNAQVLLEKYADEYAIGIVSTSEMDFNLAAPRSLAVLIGK